MKKFIRGLIKISLTPFAVVVYAIMLVVFYILLFVAWLYDSSEWSKEFTKATKECIDGTYGALKRWFTTI